MFAIKSLLLAVLLMAMFTPVANAYLDPNAGSYILQVTAAMIFGGIFIVKVWWQKIRHMFLGILNRKDKKSSEKELSAKK